MARLRQAVCRGESLGKRGLTQDNHSGEESRVCSDGRDAKISRQTSSVRARRRCLGTSPRCLQGTEEGAKWQEEESQASTEVEGGEEEEEEEEEGDGEEPPPPS